MKLLFPAAIMLCLALAASGCSGVKKETEPAQVHFQVLFPESASTIPLAKRYPDAAAAFNQLHPDIKVIIDYAEEDAQITDAGQYIVKRLESDEAPDIVSWNAGNMRETEKRGLLRDLLPLMSEETDIPQQVLDAGTIGGKLLVVPTAAYPMAVFYNKDLFDDAEIPYPEGDWTWEQFRDISRKLKSTYGSILPYDPTMFDMLMLSTGTGFLSPDGTTSVGYLDSPEAVRTLQWLNAYYADDADKTAPMGGLDVFTQFDGLQTGMIVVNAGVRFSNFEGANRDRLGVAPLPHFEGGKRANPVGLSGYAISRKSKYPEAAWEFIRYLGVTDNEYSRQLAEDYIPTSRTLAEATGVSSDPIRSVWNGELDYAVQPSGSYNSFFHKAWNDNLTAWFQELWNADDQDIPDRLHQLAEQLDQELNRLQAEESAEE